MAHIILQRINTRIFKNPVAMMENIRRVTTHVRSRLDVKDADRRVLQLVPTREGRAWHVDDEEQYWRAYRFIEGAKSFDEVNSERQAFEAAKAFGEFQRMLADLPGSGWRRQSPIFTTHRRRFTDFEWCPGRRRCRPGKARAG